ncbi:hypothetical protein MTTB_03380 [Methanothermobacter tenebrarum]|uniref:SpoVT-AbrB domain-containing protein n=1 Tax=Methanothermobacter tenebrarum TaxID=680118 RepID=A0ABM7YC98_9EURY|nr:hypothetical protein [Methanothermobacter tenebrarum]MDI6882206.1 hypothetical protein [Methanothermobacter sp.]MDX9694135.1 hypothetical protein [Methanothermobacter sp.]BDH78959.1 hypothetical protein MTTB_03380 [Methanothermobacter tenebrarum]HOQ20508.1 hypothetical protein [Methanothermobacter sp.]
MEIGLYVTGKVREDGTIAIPRSIRETFRMEEGKYVNYKLVRHARIRGGTVTTRSISRTIWERLTPEGALKIPEDQLELYDIREGDFVSIYLQESTREG